MNNNKLLGTKEIETKYPQLLRIGLLDHFNYKSLKYFWVSPEHTFGDINNMINCCSKIQWHLFFTPKEFSNILRNNIPVGIAIYLKNYESSNDDYTYANLIPFKIENKELVVVKSPYDLTQHLILKRDTIGTVSAIFFSDHTPEIVSIIKNKRIIPILEPDIFESNILDNTKLHVGKEIYFTRMIGLKKDRIVLNYIINNDIPDIEYINELLKIALEKIEDENNDSKYFQRSIYSIETENYNVDANRVIFFDRKKFIKEIISKL